MSQLGQHGVGLARRAPLVGALHGPPAVRIGLAPCSNVADGERNLATWRDGKNRAGGPRGADIRAYNRYYVVNG